jgi:tetratricopeptide (TPR) repeat protein
MTRVHAIRSLLLLTLATTLLGCEGHGQYTSAFKEDAVRNMSRIRAATEYDMAFQQYRSGDLVRALATVDNSIKLHDEVPKGHLLRGRILYELERYQEALDALERGSALDPIESEFHYYRGVVLERTGRTEAALEAYRQAVALDPAAAHYRLAVAEVLIDLRRLDEARAWLESDDAVVQMSAGAIQTLGHIAMMQGDVDRAVRCFAEAAVLRPDDPVLRDDLCRAQIAARRFAEAEANLRRLAHEKHYESRRDLKHLHAACLIELDRPVEARGILLSLLRDDGGANDTEAWVKLIDVALILRDDGLLRTAANRLIAAAPDRYEGYLALAMWRRKNGDLEGALRSLDIAVQRAGTVQTPAQLRSIVERQLSAAADR